MISLEWGSTCPLWWFMMKSSSAGTRILGSMTVSLLLVSIWSCSNPDPCKIGFLGSSAAGVSDMSIAARNGVILAIEEVNRTGGLSGRSVELLIKDDNGNPDSALKGMEYFVDQRVDGIIGPVTAEIARVVAPLAKQAKVVMISPTADSADLPGQDDFFFPGFSNRQK